MLTRTTILDLLKEHSRLMRERFSVRKIGLFGSYVRDEAATGSDIDLLVLESAPGDTRQESVRIRRAVRGLGYPFDIIVMSAERFEESKNVVGGIAYPANKYGKVIYEAV